MNKTLGSQHMNVFTEVKGNKTEIYCMCTKV